MFPKPLVTISRQLEYPTLYPPPELTIDHAWSQEPLSQKPTCLIILVDTATLELFLPHSLNALDPPNLFQPLHLQ